MLSTSKTLIHAATREHATTTTPTISSEPVSCHVFMCKLERGNCARMDCAAGRRDTYHARHYHALQLDVMLVKGAYHGLYECRRVSNQSLVAKLAPPMDAWVRHSRDLLPVSLEPECSCRQSIALRKSAIESQIEANKNGRRKGKTVCCRF
jgi:hypothetical protein